MSFEIELHKEDIILEIRHVGEVTLQDAIASRAAASESARQHGFKHILADTTKALTKATTSDLYEFNTTWGKFFSQGTRIASVLGPTPIDEVETSRNISFAETVAANRGIMHLVFRNREDALIWLRDEAIPDRD